MQTTAQHFLGLALDFLKVLAFFAAIVLPTTWVCFRRLTGQSIIARLALGTASGFSIFVVAAWYIGLWSLNGLIWFWLAQMILATWFGRVSGPSDVTSDSDLDAARTRTRTSSLVLLPLCAGVLVQLYAMHFASLPPGVDSSFHCVVGQRQLDAGRATMDLWPLEELRLNYPIGSHLWLAVAAQWTGLEIHEVFKHSFTLALCGAALCVGAWSERVFGSAAHAVMGAFAFVFGSFQSSLFPFTWGGLPSALAMWQGLAALFCVLHVEGRAGWLIAAPLFAATAMTHHHTMVAFLGGVGVVAVVRMLLNRGLGRGSQRVLSSLLAATALAGVYLVPLVDRVGELKQTGTLDFCEPFSWPWEHLWSGGPGLVVTSGLGMFTAYQASARQSRWFLLNLAIFWLASFLLLDYAGRWLGSWWQNKAVTPFTPSRFLFDLQFVLAVFAGGGLMRLWHWFARPAFRYALIVAIGCWAIWQTEPRWEPNSSDLLIPVGRWVRVELPKDALVTGLESIWVTYVCHRESTSLFIPISEPTALPRARIKEALRRAPWMLPGGEWSERLHKPIYAIGSAQDESWGNQPVFVSGPLGVFRVTPE